MNSVGSPAGYTGGGSGGPVIENAFVSVVVVVRVFSHE